MPIKSHLYIAYWMLSNSTKLYMLTEINKMETIFKDTKPIVWHVISWVVAFCLMTITDASPVQKMATRILVSLLHNEELYTAMYTYVHGDRSIGCLQQRPLTVQINFWQGEKTKCILKLSTPNSKEKQNWVSFFPSISEI